MYNASLMTCQALEKYQVFAVTHGYRRLKQNKGAGTEEDEPSKQNCPQAQNARKKLKQNSKLS